MFLSLLLIVSFSCLVEGQPRPPSKNVIKTAPTFFATSSSSNTESGCPAESAIDIDQQRRNTRNIINNNYKFRPHQCGGPEWTKAYYLNMKNSKSQCPVNWTLHNDVRACGRKSSGAYSCDSLIIPVSNMKYFTICGRIYAYQYGRSYAFRDPPSKYQNYYYTEDYSFGLSLTHGGFPKRRHVWSFVASPDETPDETFINNIYLNHFSVHCPCTNTTNTMIPKPSSFVGDDYFCDTGALSFDGYRVYKKDPLWDGEGCGSVSTCCSFNSPPWFYKKLNYSTQDDMELRICGFNSRVYEDKLVYLVEIYIK